MKHKRLENLIEAVELLRPLLIGARSLEEDAELIWRLINGDLPLVRVSLVWLSQRLELEAFASFGGGEEEQAARSLLDRRKAARPARACVVPEHGRWTLFGNVCTGGRGFLRADGNLQRLP